MKFKGFIHVSKPSAEVAKFFADPQYLGEYQDGFVEKIHVSGDPGKDGAISKMYYKYGKRDMELTETIITNRLPEYFEAHYHHIHMDNTMACRFIALDEATTRYEYEFEYTRINWIMPKLMSILFPGMYKKPAAKWMQQFKAFVEKQ